MSDQKPSKTIQDIQQEYQGLCTKLGHMEYQVYTINKDIELLKSTLRDLNFEAASVQSKNAEIAKALADAKAKESEDSQPQNKAKVKLSAVPSEGEVNV